MKKHALGLAALVIVAASIAQASPIIDVSNDKEFSWRWNESLTLGYQFHVGNPLTVNAFGVFDVISATPAGVAHVNAAGLNYSHQVGLWNSSGTMIASTTVNPGDPTMASVNTYGQWVYHSITALTLNPGDYTIGALFLGTAPDPVMVQQTALPIAGVTYLGGRYAYVNTLTLPTGQYSPNEQQYFGPTLLNIPDGGATWVLLLLGSAGLVGAKRKLMF